MRANRLFAGILIASAGTGALAQKPDNDGDLRCVAIISSMVSQQAPEKQGNLLAGVMYFIGHLDGVAPKMDLKVELRRVAATLTQELATTEAQRCGKILQDKGQLLQDVGAALQGPAPK